MEPIHLFQRCLITVTVLISLAFAFIGCATLEQAQQKRAMRLKQKHQQEDAVLKGATESQQTHASIGQPAPPFTLRGLNDERVSLSDFRGKPIVLNFWATWCPRCREEIPHIEGLYKEHKDQGLVVIGVNDERDHAKVKQFAQTQISYIVLLDGSAQFQQYDAGSIPCTYYIDRTGIIRHRDTGFGPSGEMEIERQIQELLQ